MLLVMPLTTAPKNDKCVVAQTRRLSGSPGTSLKPSEDQRFSSVSQKAQVAPELRFAGIVISMGSLRPLTSILPPSEREATLRFTTPCTSTAASSSSELSALAWANGAVERLITDIDMTTSPRDSSTAFGTSTLASVPSTPTSALPPSGMSAAVIFCTCTTVSPIFTWTDVSLVLRKSATIAASCASSASIAALVAASCEESAGIGICVVNVSVMVSVVVVEVSA
mmetsp:Transcript_82843/g.177575  ORF Transcript_82843/g.177575 Transcript_82843/m.177575 type:complete len:225 (-) Transcript_82843:1241-1915(-)